ncbi:hypothetical protein [Kitasatospora sp. NPDC059673]|uniref:hypothetical protein n=1 Tax=Kitasatospora sp. NPDC059673 TaxID=3346901 RepID=UPI0036B87BEB
MEIEPEIRDRLSALPSRSRSRALWARKSCQPERLPAYEAFGRAVTKGDIR